MNELTTDKLLAKLEIVSTPERPKTKKKPKIRQKKQYRPHRIRSDRTPQLSTIAKVILHEGGNTADLGVILGCLELDSAQEWLAELKAQNLPIEEFMAAAKQQADIELIRATVKAAMGYTYKEESQTFTPVYEEGDEGEIPKVKGYIPGKKKIQEKPTGGDATLLKFLLSSRMPKFFSDTKHVKIDKRVIELKADAEDEIREFASGLLQALDGDVVDAEFVEPLEETER